MARMNDGTYNFGRLAIGDSFTVKPIKVHSMKNSLVFFNKKHGKAVEVSIEEISDAEVRVTRVK